MFLPTKAFMKEIHPGQYRLRKGNRVPKGAVNLAYAHIRELAPNENIRITDLSNRILENQQNAEFIDQIMFPSSSMLLENMNYDCNIPASDILITNSFKDNVPLYYSYRLKHRIYDKKGPDKHGVYSKTGMVVIDKFGQDVTRPYRFEITPDPQNLNMYFVDLLTSFNDVQSEEYMVVYNAVEIEDNGVTTTKAGHRERIVLTRAFVETDNINKIVQNYTDDSRERVFYKANAPRPYNSKIYVGAAEFFDDRPYEFFRYQVGVEIDYEHTTEIFTSPWYSDYVIHTDYLSDAEKKEYYNGYKKITTLKAEEMMKGFSTANSTYGDINSMRYFINIDNPNVRDSTRADGSSEVFVKSITRYPTYQQRELPENIRIISRPYELTSKVELSLRTLYSLPTEMAHISFVMDNSQSMGTSDPMKLNRLKIMESAVYAAIDYYRSNRMNCIYFANLAKEIRYDFEPGGYNIVDTYSEKAPLDLDVTRPERGVEKAIELLDASATSEFVDGITKQVKKFIILVTDGEYDEKGWDELELLLDEAKTKGYKVAVFTFNNFETLEPLCLAYNAICYDAEANNVTLMARNIFFDLAGLDAIKMPMLDIPFTTSPPQNDKKIAVLDHTYLALSPQYNALVSSISSNPDENSDRWAVELKLYDNPALTYNENRMLTMKVKRNDSKTYVGTLRTKNLIRVKDIWNNPSDPADVPITYDVYIHSNSYKFYITNYYSVRFNDRQKIQLLMPREQSAKESWYARIKNGRFDREAFNKPNKPIETFSIPEYYRQDFVFGEAPVVRVEKEHPVFINETTIQLSCTPFILDQSNPNTSMDVYVNGNKMSISDWNSFNGLVELSGVVSENDTITVDYSYEENSYVYKGFFDDTGRFWHLDLNPSVGHYSTYLDPMDNTVKDVPSFFLLNETVYFYIKASASSEVDIHGNVLPVSHINKYTVMHTFQRLHDDEHLLIGEIRVRPNSNRGNIRLFDSRTRGGGLLENIDLSAIQQAEPESIYYWDVGYWDGQPFPENGIAVIRLSRYILKEYGGRFSKVDVEEKVKKHLALGVLPIIEYLDDPEVLIPTVDGLTVEIHEVEELGNVQILKPTFALEVK